MTTNTHRAGFVNLIGPPNVGKSTLLNALLGEALVITNPKAQTTRHRILGILNGEDHQIVLSDTPGILVPRYRLQKKMMQAVDEAVRDADVLLILVEPGAGPESSPEVVKRAVRSGASLAVLVNKMDESDQATLEHTLAAWQSALPGAKVAAISALHGFNVPELRDWLIAQLPEHPAYFPKDQISDRHLRFFVAEIIREKILALYHQEIPYSTEVRVTAFLEEPTITRIEADVIVMRESQKGIIIGPAGSTLRRLGTAARKAVEEFLDAKVFLRFRVVVDEDWREDDRKLRNYGYGSNG